MNDNPEIKPAFARWMRRQNPILENEDTNPLFEAFRRRRKLYPKLRSRGARVRTFLRTLRTPRGAMVSIGLAMMVGALPFGAMLLVAMGEMLFILGIVLQAIRGYQYMPLSMTFLFHRKNTGLVRATDPYQAERELWMTGLNGSTFLEAAYLEYCVAAGRIFLVTPWVAVAGFLVALLLVPESLETPLLLPALAALYFGWEAMKSAPAWNSFTCVEFLVAFRVACWKKRGTISMFLYGLSFVLKSYLVVFLYALEFVLMGIAVFLLIQLSFEATAAVGACALLVLSGVLCRVTRPWIARYGQRRYDRLLPEGDRLFPNFFYRQVMEDPDADHEPAPLPH